VKLALLLVLLAYAPDARRTYLSEAIVAIRSADPEKLNDAANYLRTMDRNKCRSAFRRLRVQCLIEAAARNCRSLGDADRKRECTLYSDIIVTSVIAENQMIDEERRYEIMQRYPDYRTALRAEARRLHGTLAADFRLSEHYSCEPGDTTCLAGAIDSYCSARADQQNLSWQHCAAGLVWFIGTAR
jgi:hypothetical protein